MNTFSGTVWYNGKVDKVEGERLINASEITKLGNQEQNRRPWSTFIVTTYATITARRQNCRVYYSHNCYNWLQSVTDSQNSTFSAFYADAISPTMQLQEQNGVMSSSYFKFSAQKQMGLKLSINLVSK
jgi:putative alpha-1,2-mannosidase